MRLRLTLLTCLTVLLMLSPVLQAQQTGPDQHEVYIVPFSHLDLFWACTQEECLSRGNNNIGRAIQLADKHPQFRYLLENEDFVADFVESHHGTPELEKFEQLVKRGQIEISPAWAAIYQNEPRGEALVRNLLYGKKYAWEQFGVDPQVAHVADIPGFTWQYPQILSDAGTPYMVMTRMAPRDQSLFHWKAPDGSSVLVWNEIRGYGWGAGDGLHLELNDEILKKFSRHLSEVQATTSGPVYLPWGTDLWSPSGTLVENVSLLNQRLAPNHFRLATPSEFFRAAASTPDIPTLSGGIPSSWVSITSEPLWPAAMGATDALLTAEKFAAINYALDYADYPQEKFEALWKDALKALDHNSDGQGGVIGDERKLGYAQEASLGAGQILRDSLRNIAGRVQRPFAVVTPIVVFNPLSWTRDDAVRAHVTLFGPVETSDIDDYKKGLRLLDQKGTAIPFQVEETRGGSSRALRLAFVAQAVPSLGYKTFYLVPAQSPDTFADAIHVTLQSDDDAKEAGDALGSDGLESDVYRVTVDRATGRIEIFDKELKRVVAKNIEIDGVEERGGDDQNIVLPTGRQIVDVIKDVRLEEQGPVKAVLRISGAVGSIPIVQRLTLYRGLKKFDIEDTVEWKPGVSCDLQQIFPLAQSTQIRYGTPFGSVTPSDIMPGAKPSHGDELTPQIWETWKQIQDWIFAGIGDWGFTISADHQLMIVDDGAIRASMLRGPRFNPTKVVRNGQTLLNSSPVAATYVFHYSFTSGQGDWAAQKPWRAGMSLSSPLIPVMSADTVSHKPLPAEQSFVSLQADNLVVTALKKSSNDGTIVLRSFEMAGASAESPVYFLGKNRSFAATNLLEVNSGAADQSSLNVPPHAISTIKLRQP